MHTFKTVFGPECTQTSIFDRVGIPLVEDLLAGKNGKVYRIEVGMRGSEYIGFYSWRREGGGGEYLPMLDPTLGMHFTCPHDTYISHFIHHFAPLNCQDPD